MPQCTITCVADRLIRDGGTQWVPLSAAVANPAVRDVGVRNEPLGAGLRRDRAQRKGRRGAPCSESHDKRNTAGTREAHILHTRNRPD